MKHHSYDMHHNKVGKGAEEHSAVEDAIRSPDEVHSERNEKMKYATKTSRIQRHTKDHKHRLNRPLL